jgi:pimeloyl-ACP methyl ester carboxylesterase
MMAAIRATSRLGIALFACGLVVDACAAGADYAREDRLVAEIVPAIVVGDPVYLATSRRPSVLAILTMPEVKPVGGAVIVHGLGVHADWGLINGLRTDLSDAGIATLSVQMPVLAADAPRTDYAALYPEAGERIAAGIAFLRSHGIGKIAIVAHSLGAVMADRYLASSGGSGVAAWVPIGMQGDFAAAPRQPVLDVIAENDVPEVLGIAPVRANGLPRDACSRQITIRGTDHFMANRRKELAQDIGPFLARAFDARC